MPTDANPEDSKADRRFWLALLAITVVAAGWRVWGLETPAFDHDEAYEIVTHTTDLAELAGRHDGFPPLYRWLLGGILEATGSDRSARWFSLLAGVATIPVVGLFGHRLAGPAAGVVAALLMAFSANHVLLSQHARGYALLVFFCSLMLLTAWRLRQSDRWSDWAPFLIASWLAVATHYFGGLLLILLGGLLLIEKRGASRKHAVQAAVALAIAGLPLVACLRADLAETGEFHDRVEFDAEAYAFTYLGMVSGYTLGPSVSELRDLVAHGEKTQAIARIMPWALGIAASVGVLLVAGWRRLRPGDRAWLAVLLIAPPIIALLVAPFSPTGYNYRYIAWMVIPLVAWCAAGATEGRRRPVVAIAALSLLALGVVATANRHLDPRYYENDFHAVAALIEERGRGDAPPAVIAAPLYYGQGVLYSLPDEWLTETVTAHPSGEQDWDAKLPAMADRLGGRGEVWLVTQWFPESHPQRAVCDALAERLNAELVERVSSTVMVYRVDADNVR